MVDFDEYAEKILSAQRLVVLTGAGASTLSGIPDFRGVNGFYATGDTWCGHSKEELLHIDFASANWDVFYKFAREELYTMLGKEPCVVHQLCATLEQTGHLRTLYTQNIDSLHYKAGSKNVVELHGSLDRHICTRCGEYHTYSELVDVINSGELPHCKLCGALVRPDVVFYGEGLGDGIYQAEKEFTEADMVLVMGTSLTVHPVASLPLLSCRNGGEFIIVNAQPTPYDRYALKRFSDLGDFCTQLEKRLS